MRKILFVILIILLLGLVAKAIQADSGRWTCLATPVYEVSPKAKKNCNAMARGATQMDASLKAEKMCENKCGAKACLAEACAGKR